MGYGTSNFSTLYCDAKAGKVFPTRAKRIRRAFRDGCVLLEFGRPCPSVSRDNV